MKILRSFVISACVMMLPTLSIADMVRPEPKDGMESACRVTGLDPNGDGFLAVRRGPGSSYDKIGEVYNGDTIAMERPCRGNWCYADNIYRGGEREASLHGWFHINWCHVYAG